MASSKGQGFLGFEVTYYRNGKRASLRFWVGNSTVAVIMVVLIRILGGSLSRIAQMMTLGDHF